MDPSIGAQPILLIVEPSSLFRTQASELCHQSGFDCVIAEDVAQALGIVCEGNVAGVLTALQVSGLPGTSLIAALKSSPMHRALPIGLMTSADAVEHHLGAYHPDRIVQKNGRFVANLSEFLSSLRGAKSADQENAPANGGQEKRLDAKILLAEDSASLQKLISRFLHRSGASVTVADDGRQAVQLAEKTSFDLILMDIEMPEMNGFEAAETLRKKGIQTPIIALTAHDPDRIQSELERVGCDGMLAKPVDREQLVEVCLSYLEKVA